MATVIGEKNSERTGELTLDTQRPSATRKRWSTLYYVRATLDETEDDVLSAATLPLLGYPYRNGFCISKKAKEDTAIEGGVLWHVVCEFDSHVEADIPVVDVSWDVEEKEEVLQWDAVTGLAIVNSACEPIITEHPISIPVLSMTRVEASFSPALILLYNNTVNSAPFMGAPPKCALMQGPIAKKKIIHGIRMWDVTYKVKFNMRIDPTTLQPMGWMLFLLDYGTRYIEARVGNTTLYSTFRTEDDDTDTTGLLDGLGKPLPDDDPYVFLPYNRYPISNFNLLNLE